VRRGVYEHWGDSQKRAAPQDDVSKITPADQFGEYEGGGGGGLGGGRSGVMGGGVVGLVKGARRCREGRGGVWGGKSEGGGGQGGGGGGGGGKGGRGERKWGGEEKVRGGLGVWRVGRGRGIGEGGGGGKGERRSTWRKSDLKHFSYFTWSIFGKTQYFKVRLDMGGSSAAKTSQTLKIGNCRKISIQTSN